MNGRRQLLLLALAAVTLAGCASRATSQAKLRRAYLAGRQEAIVQRQSQETPAPPAGAPTVTFVGPVKNPVLIWSAELTLAQAIIDAGYESVTDPSAIVIYRNGQQIPINPRQLLGGQDILLEAGDVVQIQP